MERNDCSSEFLSKHILESDGIKVERKTVFEIKDFPQNPTQKIGKWSDIACENEHSREGLGS